MNKDDLFAMLFDESKNPYGFDPVATHGFLTATVVGKPLPNWMDVYFDGNGDKADPVLKEGLEAWRNEIIATLKDESPVELPFDTNDDEEDFGEDSDIVAWCIGFIEAMYSDNAADWFDDSETEEDVAELTLPMVILSGMDEENEDLAVMREDQALLAELANSLEDNVTELFLLFHTDD